jgi:hypothetical protein
MTAPCYQDVRGGDVPEVVDDDGTVARVVCGEFWGKRGPVDGIAADPVYLDLRIPPGVTKRLPVETSRHAFAYVFEGEGRFAGGSEPAPVRTDALGEARPGTAPEEASAGNRTLVLFDRGDEVVVRAGETGMRFLLVSGKPLAEPVAWYGPIVMNTDEELATALSQLRDGTFLAGG